VNKVGQNILGENFGEKGGGCYYLLELPVPKLVYVPNDYIYGRVALKINVRIIQLLDQIGTTL